MQIQKGWSVVFGAVAVLLLSSCMFQPERSAINASSLEGIEEPYYVVPIQYSGPTTTIRVAARFQRYSDLTGNLETRPIPFVEFYVTNQNGQVIQRGESGSDGNIRAIIPRSSVEQVIRVHIRSRGYNEGLRASILSDPYHKRIYEFKSEVIVPANTMIYPEESDPPLNLVASANITSDPQLVVGAFNILYNIFLTTVFLKENIPQINIPKVNVYWKVGETPATYLGGRGPISFYVPQTTGSVIEGMYILGGIGSHICGVDTDHFDNSVIIHEYAHFLESKFSQIESPGGHHDGNLIIDPRLAWSEGWANYLQGAVLNRNFYRDTFGIGCPGAHLTNLQMPLVRIPSSTDVPIREGEGNFREMSVARYLFSLTSNHAKTDQIMYSGHGYPFSLVWNYFLSLGGVIGGSIHHFNQNLRLSHSVSSDFFSATGQSFLMEKQNATWRDWSWPLVESSSPCSPNPQAGVDNQGYFSFAQGIPTPDYSGARGRFISCGDTSSPISWSDMLNSNDFWQISFAAPMGQEIVLEYESAVSGQLPYDLDLYLYKGNFVFLRSTDIVRASDRYYPEVGSSMGQERVSLLGVNPGTYFLNIKVDNSGCSRATTRYRLRLGSSFLCPVASP
ncbi:MAG: hypothetical protein NZ480_01080 [Bdellovibrionaceae bacterium]|nr:hypothetical protein [Pseudobdellovibrionaceae bacterium]